MFKYSNDQIGPVSPAENFCFWQGFNVCIYCLICFVLFVFSLKLLKKADKNSLKQERATIESQYCTLC